MNFIEYFFFLSIHTMARISLFLFTSFIITDQMVQSGKIYEVHTISFQTFFCMGSFIDSTHIKLEFPSK